MGNQKQLALAKKNLNNMAMQYQKTLLSVLPKEKQRPEKIAKLARLWQRAMDDNEALALCDPMTHLGCMAEALTYDLEPCLGEIYLVPYGQKCTIVLGYKGLMELARRSDKIVKIHSRVVYTNDVFEIEQGFEEKITHKPCLDDDKGDFKGVYAFAIMKEGDPIFEYMSKKQVDEVMNQAKTQKVWSKHYDEMARKTAVRRLAKYLPMNDDSKEMIALDDEPDLQQPHKIIDINYELSTSNLDYPREQEVKAREDAKNSADEEKQQKLEAAICDLEASGVKKEELFKALHIEKMEDILTFNADHCDACFAALSVFAQKK